MDGGRRLLLYYKKKHCRCVARLTTRTAAELRNKAISTLVSSLARVETDRCGMYCTSGRKSKASTTKTSVLVSLGLRPATALWYTAGWPRGGRFLGKQYCYTMHLQ